MKIFHIYYMMYERFSIWEENEMNTTECIRTRRSIRKFKPDPIDHFLLESIISTASYSPSWKNSQIVRYIAIEDSSILNSIMNNYTPDSVSYTHLTDNYKSFGISRQLCYNLLISVRKDGHIYGI